MNPRLKRRLFGAFIALVLFAVPSIWIVRQYRQVKLDRALIAAIKRSDAVDVDALLCDGANPNTRNTPQSHRSFRGLLRDLLHHPPPDKASTALMMGAEFSATRIVKTLISAHADVNAKDYFGCTALIWAANTGNADCVETLISAGSNVNVKNRWGYTPLIYAAGKGDDECVKFLIASGADLNVTNTSGYTAMSLARRNTHLAAASILRAAGAKE